MVGAADKRLASFSNVAIRLPVAALTTLSPHCAHTPAGTFAMTTSFPLIQNSWLIVRSRMSTPQTWHCA